MLIVDISRGNSEKKLTRVARSQPRWSKTVMTGATFWRSTGVQNFCILRHSFETALHWPAWSGQRWPMRRSRTGQSRPRQRQPERPRVWKRQTCGGPTAEAQGARSGKSLINKLRIRITINISAVKQTIVGKSLQTNLLSYAPSKAT